MSLWTQYHGILFCLVFSFSFLFFCESLIIGHKAYGACMELASAREIFVCQYNECFSHEYKNIDSSMCPKSKCINVGYQSSLKKRERHKVMINISPFLSSVNHRSPSFFIPSTMPSSSPSSCFTSSSPKCPSCCCCCICWPDSSVPITFSNWLHSASTEPNSLPTCVVAASVSTRLFTHRLG